KGSRRNNFTFCCRPPGPLARRERRAIPGASGAVCEERATKPASLRAAARRGAAAGGALLRCRSSTTSDMAFVAAPPSFPPGVGGSRTEAHTLPLSFGAQTAWAQVQPEG